jgi:selenocysteine lyase/cysteine desulfurase
VPAASVESFRSRFPIFGRRVYVNSCSQGALSTDVEHALTTFVDSWRTGGSPWDQWIGELERLRAVFAAFVGADVDEVAVMPNATTAAAAVATALPFDGSRRRVVMGGVEFPTMAHLWQAQASRGAEIVWAGDVADAMTTVDAFRSAIDERTRIVSLAAVCFRNGYRLDVRPVVARAHGAGALVMLDDYQHTGTAPIDVHELGVDVLVTGTLKYLLGPPGVAFLYVRRGLIDQLEPLVTGWFGRTAPFAFGLAPLDWAVNARRFETGSPPVPSIYGAVAGLELLRSVGSDVVSGQIAHLVDRFMAGARARGFDVVTPDDPERRGALVVVRSSDAQSLAVRLAAHGIIASARGTGLRVSFHAYNNDDDVESVLTALDAERSLLGPASRP